MCKLLVWAACGNGKWSFSRQESFSLGMRGISVGVFWLGAFPPHLRQEVYFPNLEPIQRVPNVPSLASITHEKDSAVDNDTSSMYNCSSLKFKMQF